MGASIQPTLAALKKLAESSGAFGLNGRDQEELWSFVVPLLVVDEALQDLWNFAIENAVERAVLVNVAQEEADERGVTPVRVVAAPVEPSLV